MSFRVSGKWPSTAISAIRGSCPYFPPSSTPKSRFDNLEGETRLRALEDALSSETSAHHATETGSDSPIMLSISCAI